jgi:ATP-dependent Zn protease
MNPKRREATALHEAGHAVAGARLFPAGRTTGRTRIEPDDEAGTGAHHEAEDLVFAITDDPSEFEAQSAEFRKEAVYDCAGYAALIAAGYSEADATQGCGSDFDKAAGNAYTTLEAAKTRAVELMREPKNIAAVQRVADELLRKNTLEPDEVAILIEIADGESSEADY